MSKRCNAYRIIWLEQSVSFDVPNSLASVLGFAQRIYGFGRRASDSILLHCNIIHSTYMHGTKAPVAYNFFPNAAPRHKILELPHNLIYLPIAVDVISTLSVWLTDQHGKLLDLRGEELTIRFHFHER